jgi:hypothetical protein
LGQTIEQLEFGHIDAVQGQGMAELALECIDVRATLPMDADDAMSEPREEARHFSADPSRGAGHQDATAHEGSTSISSCGMNGGQSQQNSVAGFTPWFS